MCQPDVFQLADRVVGEISHCSGGKRRQAGKQCGTVPPQLLFHDLKNIPLPPLGSLALLNGDFISMGANLHVRSCA